MEDLEYQIKVDIEIPHPPGEEFTDEEMDEILDAIADLVFDWAKDKYTDPLVAATKREPISESPPKQDPPPTDPLVREADSESKHDITIVSLLGEVVIVCDTCHDELGAKLDEVTLNEILACVDLHVNGPPDIDCITLPDGSCIAEPCSLHDPRPHIDPPCTGHPSTHDCTCANGIGCINVPFEDW